MTRPVSLPVVLLLAYACAFASTALGFSLIVFDDHPGQLYRVWHVVTHGFAPWRWNDGWWAGYPELQFYPPGFAYAAALLHLGSLRLLTVEASYQTLLWFGYAAPGVTTWALLVRLGAGPWGALPGAFIALTLSAGVASGVEGGVRTGMVAARQGWALLPFLGSLLVPWCAGRAAPLVSGVLVTAALVLTHPAHVPAAIGLVVLAALAAPPRARRLIHAMTLLTLAAMLTAFWSLPLLARLAETRALAWGRLTTADALATFQQHPLLVAVAVLAIVAVAVAREPAARAFAALPWVLALAVAVDAGVLERRGINWLPADRVVDGVWLAAVVAAGLALGRLLGAAARRWAWPMPALSLGSLVAIVALSLFGANTLALWPRPADWPTMEATARGLRLTQLWNALREAPAGRILFVRSGVPLVYGPEWWRPHTHVTALAPLVSGRSIVNGTFTHPSPVAALLYRGTIEGGAITELVERLDGRSLFGVPLVELDAATFNRYAERLRVSAVVALDEDRPTFRAVEANAHFPSARVLAPFVVWTRTSPVGMLPERVAPDRLRVRLAGDAGAWTATGIAYYPLWRALDGNVPLATRRGPFGDLEVELRQPGAVVDLVYAARGPEVAGLAVSGLALAALAVLAWRARRLGSLPRS